MINETRLISGNLHFGFDWTVTVGKEGKTQSYISISMLLGLYNLIKKNRLHLQFKMFVKGNTSKANYKLLKKQITQLADIKNALSYYQDNVEA